MKKIVFGVILLSTIQLCFSQKKGVENDKQNYLIDTAEIARLQTEIRNAKEDSTKVLTMLRLTAQYSNNLDSGIHYSLKALNLSRKVNFHKGELTALGSLEIELKHHGVLLKAYNICHKGLQASRRYRDKHFEAAFIGELGILYRESGVYKESMTYLRKSKTLYDSIGERYYSAFMLNNIGEVYLLRNELDSALSFCRLAFKGVEGAPRSYFWMTFYTSLNLGNIFMGQANYDSSLYYLKLAKQISAFHSQQFNTNLSIAKVFEKLGLTDSSLFYSGEANRVALLSGAYLFNAEVNDFLGKFYHARDIDQSIKFTRRSLAYKDSLYRQSVSIAFENIDDLDEQERQFEIQSARAAYQFRTRLIGLLAGVLVLLIILGILVRNYKQKQKSIVLLNKQKDELNTAREKTELALSDLKATQSQLIQSEKMASLGDITAGIAHEIQNPLNFVNNFSEVNSELIDELTEELASGNSDAINKIASDIKVNQQKISLHGKRADAIVKSMLQHSRGRTGQKELVDLNALCDEYLRLAFHGFRAKDNSFNAKSDINFDSTIPKINIITQDIGRVILNLINNAFYAVRERVKNNHDGYEPTVSLTSKRLERFIEIRVQDNGSGIPDHIKDKIFQPFFTTKPTGQGTGLGLSLSYDIIKAHGGTLEVSSPPAGRAGKQAEGSVFIIQLPT